MPRSSHIHQRWYDNPLPELLRLAWPLAVSVLSFSIMSLVDALFIARVGAGELAGVGIGSLVLFTLSCFAVGLFRGQKTLVAQACGANQGDRVEEYLGAGLLVAVALGAAAVVVGLLVGFVLPGLAAGPDAGRAADSYFSIRLWSLPMVIAGAALREHSYGCGNTRTPMIAVVCANAVNIGLDTLLIVHLELGAAGAAWASVAATSVQLAILFWAMRPRWRGTHTWRLVPALWHIGWPTGLQFLVDVGSFTLMSVIISGISEVDMAAHQLALQAIHLSFLPAYALAEAASVLVGRAVGADRDDLVLRVARVALVSASVYTGLCTVVLLAASDLLAGLLAGDGEVSAMVARLLFFSAVFQIVDGAAVVGGGVLRGTGDVRVPALVSVSAAWACTPTACWILGVHYEMGAMGGWIGISLELALVAGLFWWRVVDGKWRRAAIASRAQLALNHS